MLKNEQWQLRQEPGTIPLASLLKRSLERVEHLVHQRQLWSQVHNEANVNISGDIHKIELVLAELLTLACLRSPMRSAWRSSVVGGRAVDSAAQSVRVTQA